MTGNVTVGAIGVLVASILWGSNFIVVRQYDMPADGVCFAFVMSIGILLVGLVTLVSSPMQDGDFEVVLAPCGLLGGALWALGNFLTVPIIQCIGLGVGLAIWAGTNMIVAFLVGAMGLESIGIHLPKETLKHPYYGGLGVVLALCALILFAQVKPNIDAAATTTTTTTTTTNQVNDTVEERNEQQEVLLPTRNADVVASSVVDNDRDLERPTAPLELSVPEREDEGLRSRRVTAEGDLTNTDSSYHGTTVHVEDGSQPRRGNKAPLGIALAVLAGSFYGVMFVPLQQWNDKVTRNGRIFEHDLPSDTIRALRFFFSQFAGIFLAATTGFVLYCGAIKNKPQLIPPNAVVPTILCGVLWAGGCAGAMFATSELGNTVGFPLVLNCSFLVNSFWSVVVFREIQGDRNLKLFGGAFLLNVFSSLLISISKA